MILIAWQLESGMAKTTAQVPCAAHWAFLNLPAQLEEVIWLVSKQLNDLYIHFSVFWEEF